MRNCDDQNYIRFDGINDAKWKPVQQHPSQIRSDRPSNLRVLTQPTNSLLHIIKKIISQPTRSSVIKQSRLGHFFFGWREEPITDHLRRPRTRDMTSSPG